MEIKGTSSTNKPLEPSPLNRFGCEYCGENMPYTAKNCPNCGAPANIPPELVPPEPTYVPPVPRGSKAIAPDPLPPPPKFWDKYKIMGLVVLFILAVLVYFSVK